MRDTKRVIHLFFSIFFLTKVVLVVAVLGAPVYASAGVFSFIAGLFGSSDESSLPATVNNSQTMELLRPSLNPDPNTAKGGGELAIVGGTALLSENGPSGTIADIEEGHGAGHISVYTVRKGDTLSVIAKMFGVSVNTIVWANDISGGIIREGQTLLILPVSGVRHIVKKGETLKGIVAKYKGDLTEVVHFNNLSESSVLAIGDELVIPDVELGVTATPSSLKARVRGAGGPNLEGYYIRPIAGGRKTQGFHGYNGVDLAAPEGALVLASATGDVIVSKNYGWNGGYGNYIVIAHDNGTQTLYAHLSKVAVFQGYHVVRGQAIGYVGDTGKSTGPHLHFEIRGAKNPF